MGLEGSKGLCNMYVVASLMLDSWLLAFIEMQAMSNKKVAIAIGDGWAIIINVMA